MAECCYRTRTAGGADSCVSPTAERSGASRSVPPPISWPSRREARLSCGTPERRAIPSGGSTRITTPWTYPTGSHLRAERAGNKSPVDSVAISPDGRVIASGDNHGEIWLTDRQSGRLQRRLSANGDGIAHLAFDPAGDILAAADVGGTIRLWNPATGTAFGPPLRGHLGYV